MFLRLDAVLVVGSVWLAADGVPTFNVEPFCRELAKRAAPVGDVNVCLRQEREARDQLVKEWAQFPAADRAFCQHLHTAVIRPIPNSSPASNCSAMRGICGRRSRGLKGDSRKIGHARSRIWADRSYNRPNPWCCQLSRASGRAKQVAVTVSQSGCARSPQTCQVGYGVWNGVDPACLEPASYGS
jgi:hypothetical protein